jgi:hypothetical protein
MNLKEILAESVTFSVSKLEDHKGQQVYGDPFSVKKDIECWVCDGTGKETYSDIAHECGMCNGTGRTHEWVAPYEQLNVANGHAGAILDMLGIEFDYSGVIQTEQLPILRRKLIAIKNKDTAPYTQTPTKSGGETKISKDDNGMSRIGKTATVYDAGRSTSQVERYINTLLSLIDFAQKNDAVVTWG